MIDSDSELSPKQDRILLGDKFQILSILGWLAQKIKLAVPVVRSSVALLGPKRSALIPWLQKKNFESIGHSVLELSPLQDLPNSSLVNFWLW